MAEANPGADQKADTEAAAAEPEPKSVSEIEEKAAEPVKEVRKTPARKVAQTGSGISKSPPSDSGIELVGANGDERGLSKYRYNRSNDGRIFYYDKAEDVAPYSRLVSYSSYPCDTGKLGRRGLSFLRLRFHILMDFF